jgi:hypothetical protein
MHDKTLIKITTTICGMVIIETCLVLGVDGTGMLIGGMCLGGGIGAAVAKYITALNIRKILKRG